MILGCIADDFTGATDLASMLVKGGMRAVQTIGVPDGPPPDVDAVVVALKSRTIDSREAIRASLAALRWLKANGAEQIYCKYCSTFDSTADGNIGPVAEALMIALNTDFTIACPAFPENGRTIFRGYLYVGDLLLSESGMKDHPLTPMTDASLLRVLQAQTTRKVGLVRFDTVARGAAAIRERIAALRQDQVEMAIVDAVSDADLLAIGEACEDLALVTAGSGVGLGLARNAAAKGRLAHMKEAGVLPALGGASAVLSGSCSVATNAQVAEWLKSRPGLRIDPLALAGGKPVVEEALAWAKERLGAGPVLVYATNTPEEVRAVQSRLGVAAAGKLVEDALAGVARGLVDAGVRKLVVAGGETSGAVVQALGVRMLRIGAQIDPGVPWTLAEGGPVPVALALKSGNFGGVDFFSKALGIQA
ncbi:MAG: 3-oxo-tetronate kinase [Burkholderiales bacterium]